MRVRFASIAIAAFMTACGSFAAFAADGWVVKESGKDVPSTVKALVAAIEKSPATVMATIDHKANAESADLEMAPATVVIFGNPKVGTPLMQANPKAAFDLPVRILVWDDGETTRIGYLDPATLKSRYALEGDEADSALRKMTKALDGLTDKAIASD